LTALGLMLKTFRDDVAYVERLVASFHRYNRDSLPLYIVSPEADSEFFSRFATTTVVNYSDEDIPVSYASQDSLVALATKEVSSTVDQRYLGYINQQISKLAFFKMGLVENYVAIDSDTEFIRPFGVSDFLGEGGVPFLFAQEYPDLVADPFYNPRYWKPRQRFLTDVRALIGCTDPRQLTAHNSQVMSTAILEDFEQTFMAQQKLDYVDLLNICEMEFVWYGVWAQTQKKVPFIQREDAIRMVNHQGEHLALHSLGITKAQLAKGYIGVTVNSNWSRQYGLVDFDLPPVHDYLTRGDWAKWLREQHPQSPFLPSKN